jgi:hypothetical protein
MDHASSDVLPTHTHNIRPALTRAQKQFKRKARFTA